MTSDSLNGEPRVWNARLATAIALALRDFHGGSPHHAQSGLRSALREFLDQADPSDELAETLCELSRLPRVERGAPQ